MTTTQIDNAQKTTKASKKALPRFGFTNTHKNQIFINNAQNTMRKVRANSRLNFSFFFLINTSSS